MALAGSRPLSTEKCNFEGPKAWRLVYTEPYTGRPKNENPAYDDRNLDSQRLHEAVSVIDSNTSEEELYRLIGAELSAHAGLRLEAEALVMRGRRWFDLNLSKLQGSVCGSRIVEQFTNASDRVALITAVADLVARFCIGVSPVTVASLIVKIGLKTFCSIKT